MALKVNDGDQHLAKLTLSTQKKKKKRKKKRKVIHKVIISGTESQRANTYPMYCSVLLNFLARYLADALLGILTMESSLP